MRTNRERLIETLGDMVLDIDSGRALRSFVVMEYADRIMYDVNMGIITPERPGS